VLVELEAVDEQLRKLQGEPLIEEEIEDWKAPLEKKTALESERSAKIQQNFALREVSVYYVFYLWYTALSLFIHCAIFIFIHQSSR